MPFFCYNKDDYCDHSEDCDGCDVWVKGKGGKEVPSNGDRIRAMTDEELAKILGGKCICPSVGECAKVSGDCEKCWLEWLKQPAEEVDK